MKERLRMRGSILPETEADGVLDGDDEPVGDEEDEA